MRLKKLICVALSLALILSYLPAGATAIGPSPSSGNHVRWIDRIANLPDYAQDFYSWLEDNANINGALCDPTKAQTNGNDYYYLIDVITGSVNVGAAAAPADIQAAVMSDLGDQAQSATAYAFEVYGAFDRDHPEVFWLTGQSQCGMTMSYTHNPGNGIAEYQVNVVFYLKSGDFDIRQEQYRDKAVLLNAISQRDADVQRILSQLTAGATVQDQVRQLNRILTETNSYNSSVASGGTAPAISWECISALSGSVGSDGPVCEGYARAFKVLCDQLGIPCVLAEGYGKSSPSAAQELHLWNYVQVDGSWYAVDVTWNDPQVSGQSQAVSGRETETYLLVGSTTLNTSGQSFSDSHLLRNCLSENGIQYTNGPVLSSIAYQLTEPDLPSDDPQPEKPSVLCRQLEIDPYRGTVYTAPQMEGYLFAGWYLDEQLTQPLGKDAKTGMAYAAFVDEQVLTVKCQLSQNSSLTSAAADLRLLTGVSPITPQAVVFLVDGAEFVADGLYSQLSYEQTQPYQMYGEGAVMIAAYTIKDIPRDQFHAPITVIPGWYTMDGTLVTGTSRTVCVSDGL